MLSCSPFRIHILVFALFLSLPIQGQPMEAELENYINDLEIASSDQAKISLLVKFMSGLSDIELAAGPALAHRARTIIDQIGGDSIVQNVSYGCLSRAHQELGQLDSAAYFMEQALGYVTSCKGENECSKSRWIYGNLLKIYEDLAWHEKALLLTDKILRLDNGDEITKILALEYGSHALTKLGAIDEAIGYLRQALSHPIAIENIYDRTQFAYRLSLLFATQEEQSERKYWLQVAKDMPRDDWNIANLLAIEIELARLDLDIGATTSALKGFRRALAVLDTLPFNSYVASNFPSLEEQQLTALSALVAGYTQNELPVTLELGLAVEKLQTAIETRSTFLDLEIGSLILQTLAEYHLWQKNISKASQFANKQLKFVSQSSADTSLVLLTAYEKAHEVHFAIGNFDDAYQALLASHQVDKTIRKRRKDTEIARASISLRVEEIERDAQSEREVATARFRQFWLALLAAAFVLSTVIWALLRSRRDQRLITGQNQVISQSLAEKEVLLREIHHRVKNNLQIISSLLQKQAGFSSDGDAQRLAKEGQERIQSMALVHENLYQSEQLSGVNIRSYLEDLGANISRSHSKPDASIQLELAVEDEYLDLDTAIPVGLILNELLTNAYKYAFPEGKSGQINVVFQRIGDHFELEVNDNGVGLPADHVARSSKSLGHNLVKGLVRQLEGKINWLKPAQGTKVQIEF